MTVCAPCATGMVGGGGMLAVYTGGFADDTLLQLAQFMIPTDDITSKNYRNYAGTYGLSNGDVETVGFSDFNGLGAGTAWMNVTVYYNLGPGYNISFSTSGVRGAGGSGGRNAPSEPKPCSSGINVSGTLANKPASQTLTGCFGACRSTNGDESVGMPSVGLTIDTSIDAPEDFGGPIAGVPAPEISFGLGTFASVGTFITLSGPQGIIFSAGPSIGFPISVSMPVRKGSGCGG